jgi:hypothetical protein
MAEGIEEKLRLLEERIARLEKAIPPKLVCPNPKCGLLLTIHEEYENVVYNRCSHAQCYHCGAEITVQEPKKWNWARWKRRKIRL